MHKNADLGYNHGAAKNILANLLAVQSMSVGASNDGAQKDTVTTHIASDILAKLPQSFDETMIKSSGVKITPISIVLFQEIERFNCLLAAINDSLKNLLKVTVNPMARLTRQ